MDTMTFHDWFEAEFSMIEAYDHGQFTYEDCYVLCFKTARRFSEGWN